jgi:hypothetical protein
VQSLERARKGARGVRVRHDRGDRPVEVAAQPRAPRCLGEKLEGR